MSSPQAHIQQSHHRVYASAAAQQFNTSSLFAVPDGYKPWKISNDYPKRPNPPEPMSSSNAPWLSIDPTTHAGDYMAAVKKYCLEGMLESDFVVQNNKVRNWYHAPWLHYNETGRDPLRGLTFEGTTRPKSLSATQLGITQNWAIGFYNHQGATVFGKMWADPADPKWDGPVKFPWGSIVFKLIFTTATDADLPSMVGSPSWDVATALQFPDQPPVAYARVGKPTKIRLLQMDFATTDSHSVTGWIYGTFMYNGLSGQTGWGGLMEVGLMWGNDPELTQKKFEAGGSLKESWVSPKAQALLDSLRGSRENFGWNGRMNGPADNFISACISCHQTSQWPTTGLPAVPPPPVKNDKGRWVPKDDEETMKWFKNVPSGQSWDGKGFTADTSFQLSIGYANFQAWKASIEGIELPDKMKLPAQPREGHTMFSAFA